MHTLSSDEVVSALSISSFLPCLVCSQVFFWLNWAQTSVSFSHSRDPKYIRKGLPLEPRSIYIFSLVGCIYSPWVTKTTERLYVHCFVCKSFLFIPLKIPINTEIDTFFFTVSPALKETHVYPLFYIQPVSQTVLKIIVTAQQSLVFDLVHNSAQQIVPLVFHESKYWVVTRLCILDLTPQTMHTFRYLFSSFPCNGSVQESRTREFPLLEDVNTRRSLVQVLSVAGQEHTWPLALPLPAQVTCVPRHSPRWELRAALWHLHASVGCSQAAGRAEWLSWQLLRLILWISAFRAFQRNLNDSK